MPVRSRTLPLIVGCLLLPACEPEADRLTAPAAPSIQSFALDRSAWSEAVNLGEPVNSSSNEQNSSLSPHGLSIYVASNRPGGLGANDIWIVQRDCLACPWKAPAINLGPTINSPLGEGGVNISRDGHSMIYQSARPGGFGGTDLWMSHRDDPTDDFAWEPPVNLGPMVNTADQEQGAEYVVSEGMLYFNRGNVMAIQADIWRAPMTPRGEVLAAARPVDVLNLATTNDAAPAISTDGRELIYWSFPRPGAFGRSDLFVSTRRSVNHPWSEPVLIPGLANTVYDEVAPTITHDGRAVIFFSDRPGGFGGFDLWMSTRTPSGR